MATASVSKVGREVPFISPSNILIPDDFPEDAIFSTYAVNGKMIRRPLDNGERQLIGEFCPSLIGFKYIIPPHLAHQLPLTGMLVFVRHISRWQPAMVTNGAYRGITGPTTYCDILLTETNTNVQYFQIGDMIRLISPRFLNLFPCCLIVKEKIPSNIIRLSASSDEDAIDYMDVLPISQIVDFEYKFPDEPLLKHILDQRRDAPNIRLDYWKAAMMKIMVTYVESPSEFVFTDCRFREQKEALHQIMKNLYTNDDTNAYAIPKDVIMPGMPVVLMVGGSVFARAYVEQIIDKDICTVRVVDGGGTRQVYKDALRFVHKSLTQFPNFNYRGKLAGVLPMHGTWSDTAKHQFFTMATDTKYIKGVVAYFTSDGTTALFLWTKGKENQDLWIGDEMIRRRLARADPMSLEEHMEASRKDEQALLLADLFAGVSISGGTVPEKNATASNTAAAGGGPKAYSGAAQGQSSSRVVQH